MAEKLFHIGVTFLLTVLLARYLGPDKFGLYSYAISVAAIFATAGHVGLSGLVVKHIVVHPPEVNLTMGSSLFLKLSGGLIGYLILIAYGLLYEGYNSIEFQLLAITGLTLLLIPFDIIDYWFQAGLKSRYSTIARTTGLFAGAAAKLACISSGLGLIYIISANVIQASVVAIIFLTLYARYAESKWTKWRVSKKKCKELLSDGWQVYLGSIFAVIYLKVDQVMLKWLDSADSVGIYAVAAQLSEAWYFIPVAIVASTFPKLIDLRAKCKIEFDLRFQQLLDILFMIAAIVAITMTLISEALIEIFYGEAYVDSATILTIHIWAGLFIFMRTAFSRWIIIENALMFSLITQGTGALVNVILNFIFIPKFGGIGAAYSTLIAYAFASFFTLAMYKKTRPVFLMMAKSFIFIPRIILSRANR